jgi:hypothetical protein
MTHRRLPPPQAQAFVVCREIRQDDQTGEFILVGPVGHVPIPQFPASIRVSVYAHLTGGHGDYVIELQLRDAEGDAVWTWEARDPFPHPDPLVPAQLAFQAVNIEVPQAGRYDLVLLAGGDDIASQPLLIGPAAVFRGDGWGKGWAAIAPSPQRGLRQWAPSPSWRAFPVSPVY